MTARILTAAVLFVLAFGAAAEAQTAQQMDRIRARCEAMHPTVDIPSDAFFDRRNQWAARQMHRNEAALLARIRCRNRLRNEAIDANRARLKQEARRKERAEGRARLDAMQGRPSSSSSGSSSSYVSSSAPAPVTRALQSLFAGADSTGQVGAAFRLGEIVNGAASGGALDTAGLTSALTGMFGSSTPRYNADRAVQAAAARQAEVTRRVLADERRRAEQRQAEFTNLQQRLMELVSGQPAYRESPSVVPSGRLRAEADLARKRQRLAELRLTQATTVGQLGVGYAAAAAKLSGSVIFGMPWYNPAQLALGRITTGAVQDAMETNMAQFQRMMYDYAEGR
jgi:hypothetical protein